MKNLYYLITISIVIYSASLNAQWVETNVPTGEAGLIVTINGTKLFTVTYIPQTAIYFYASTDNGATWTIAGEGGERGPMALAGNGTNMFAGYYYSQGLVFSSNNGIEWSQVDSYPGSWVTALAVDGEKVLVGNMGADVYLSLNNGIDWTSSILGESTYISSLIFSETNIFAGTTSAGIFLSIDNGGNWIPVNKGLTDTVVNSLIASGTNIFSGTRSGVFLSTDNGTNWTLVNNGLSNTSINSLAASGSNIIAGTNSDGVYLSTNNGISWTQVNEGLTNWQVFSLAVGSEYIFAGTGGGVYRRPLSELITGIDEKSDKIPSQFILEQNYPNPFNPSTIIQYAITSKQFVTLKVYDVLGNEVVTLVNEEKNPGNYDVEFSSEGLTSGIYFYKLQAGNSIETKKMILLK